MGTSLLVCLREQENVFEWHFVSRVFFSLDFSTLHSTSREADDVQMERKGSWRTTCQFLQPITAADRLGVNRLYQPGSLCQNPAGNRTTRRPPDHRKETQTAVVWSCLPFVRSGQNPSCKAQEKEEEDKADRGKGGKTTSGNGQDWSSSSPRGQWRTGKNGENWLQNHLWCPNDPRS